jgi:hypothetical protein
MIQRTELAEALMPEVHEMTYVKACFDVDRPTKLINRDYEVAKGVTIMDTHGHIAGHQSVTIETEKLRQSPANYE